MSGRRGGSAEEAPDHLGRFEGHGRAAPCKQGSDAEQLLVVLQNVLLIGTGEAHAINNFHNFGVLIGQAHIWNFIQSDTVPRRFLIGGPIGGGAYDLAQKCDVEIWVAAAALRAAGGDAAAARLFVDECPGLLSAPGPDDDAVAPFKRSDVVPPAPRRKPPRRRGLSLPPQAM